MPALQLAVPEHQLGDFELTMTKTHRQDEQADSACTCVIQWRPIEHSLIFLFLRVFVLLIRRLAA